MNNLINPIDLLIYLRVAEKLNITAAAAQLGLSKAYVSQCLKRMEESLGARLIERTTRRLHLTDAGVMLLTHARKVALEIQEAEAALSSHQGNVAGELKIATPTTFARYFLGPQLAALLQRYPLLRINVEITNRRVDLIEEGFDVVFQVGPPSQGSLIVKKIYQPNLLLCAAKKLLRQKVIEQPADLASLPFVKFENQGQSPAWNLYRDGKRFSFDPPVRAVVNDPTLMVDLVRKGIGAGYLPGLLVERDLRNGSLIELLPEFTVESQPPIVALYPSRKNISPRLKVFLQMLDDKITGKF